MNGPAEPVAPGADGLGTQEGDADVVNENSPRHARIGYQAKEWAAYWHWLNVVSGGWVDPENKARAVAAAEENLRGHGKHVKERA